MTPNEQTRNLLLAHCKAYPSLRLRDLFKFLHQSAFGCEHFVPSLEGAGGYLLEEYRAGSFETPTRVEPLDGDYSRVPLALLNDGLSPETLAHLFFLSAKKEEGALDALKGKLAVAKELIREGALPFSEKAFDEGVKAWEADGFPAVRHSETFRESYKPAYRVVSNKFVPFLPLFSELDRRLKKGAVRLAVEGGSASGKSTLGDVLKEVYDCTLFHMDDFFLRPEQRTPERFAEPGGNVDRERFLEEVLLPLKRGETVNYRRFDCSTFTLLDGVPVTPKKLVVTEGAYSMHPALSDFYDFSVFLAIDPALQRERIIKRNGEAFGERFFTEWIPLEHVYFSETGVRERCDMIIPITK